MSETLVIVDDNESFRGHARALLSSGFEVVGEATDGASGLAELRRLAPAIALLDVQLPDGSGFALAARLRADGLATTIVMTSTRDACDYAGAVADCGAAGFIPKADLCVEAVRGLLVAYR